MDPAFEENLSIPKYAKKKNSNVSKSGRKSSHRHVYVECLLTDCVSVSRGSCCTVCGKIGKIHFLESVPTGNRLSRWLTDEEIMEKYGDLPIAKVSSFYDRYLTGPNPDEC